MLSGSSSGSSSSSENTTDSFKGVINIKKIYISLNLNYSIYIFAGYMIMAFEVPSENAVALGTFQVSSDSHTINCHGMQQVTI
jgi:hypothetical protein